MYSNKLVACIKANGKVLRENGEDVLLPFGSEYSIYLKNEHSRKVQITVEIDGQDVMDGKALLLEAGDTTDLKGFVKDIYGGEDNRAFRFITKTKEISDFRGDRAEDGLVKVSYTFEKERPNIGAYFDDFRTYTNCGPAKGGFIDNVDFGNLFNGTQNNFGDNISHNVNDTMNVSYSTNSIHTNSISSDAMRSVNLGNIQTATATASAEPGITVEGSATGQAFQRGSIGALEDKSHTMIFHLKGLTENEQVQEPVTVKTKKQCPSCGKKYKSSFSYCPQDGTFLR